jgi:hypothetical protein
MANPITSPKVVNEKASAREEIRIGEKATIVDEEEKAILRKIDLQQALLYSLKKIQKTDVLKTCFP